MKYFKNDEDAKEFEQVAKSYYKYYRDILKNLL